MKLNSQQIQEHGIPISEAWYIFANEVFRNKFDSPTPQLETRSSDPEKPILSILNFFADQNDIHMYRKKAEKDRADLKQKMQSHLIEWLQEKDLFAYAHQILPTPVRQFRQIPADYWDSSNLKTGWTSNTAYDGDRKYHKIYIIDPEDFPNMELDGSKRKKGEGDKINWAIAELDRKIPNFNSRNSHKEKAKLIRDKIKSKYPKLDVYGNNFSNDTIRKTVNLYFKKHY